MGDPIEPQREIAEYLARDEQRTYHIVWTEEREYLAIAEQDMLEVVGRPLHLWDVRETYDRHGELVTDARAVAR